jgi:DNA-binding response OmpR family regulator
MKKVLLVEDDRILGENLFQKLSSEYEVAWASNVVDSIKQLKSQKWDLLILDLGLPDGSGFDVAREVSKIVATSDRPAILFLTAQSDAETRLQGYELGASEFVPKPFHLKELLIRIRHALETRPQSQDLVLGDVTINLTDLSIRSQAGGIQYPSVTDMKILKFLIAQAPRPVSRY